MAIKIPIKVETTKIVTNGKQMPINKLSQPAKTFLVVLAHFVAAIIETENKEEKTQTVFDAKSYPLALSNLIFPKTNAHSAPPESIARRRDLRLARSSPQPRVRWCSVNRISRSFSQRPASQPQHQRVTASAGMPTPTRRRRDWLAAAISRLFVPRVSGAPTA